MNISLLSAELRRRPQPVSHSYVFHWLLAGWFSVISLIRAIFLDWWLIFTWLEYSHYITLISCFSFDEAAHLLHCRLLYCNDVGWLLNIIGVRLHRSFSRSLMGGNEWGLVVTLLSIETVSAAHTGTSVSWIVFEIIIDVFIVEYGWLDSSHLDALAGFVIISLNRPLISRHILTMKPEVIFIGHISYDIGFLFGLAA